MGQMPPFFTHKERGSTQLPKTEFLALKPKNITQLTKGYTDMTIVFLA